MVAIGVVLLVMELPMKIDDYRNITSITMRPPHLMLHVDGAFKLAHHLAHRAVTSYTDL